jgi:hypothetical protein
MFPLSWFTNTDGETQMRFTTALYSLAFYLSLTALVNLLKIDAWILSFAKDAKIRKNAYARNFEGQKLRVYMDSTIQSIVNSVFCIGAAFHLAYEHWNWQTYSAEKLLFNPDPLTFFYCSLLAGYLASDLIVETVFYKCFNEVGMIIHHVIFLFACVHNLKSKIYTFQFIWLIFCETSTPFANLRWILHTLGQKDSKLYLYNGAILTMAFFFFRVIMYGLGLFHLYTLYPVVLASEKPWISKFVVPSLLVIGYLLNLYWASKIVQGLFKLIKKHSKTTKSNKKKK